MSTIHTHSYYGEKKRISVFVFDRVVSVTAAYKHADGKKIDGKRVLVDVERARTVKGWLPRRLGEFVLDSFGRGGAVATVRNQFL